MPWVREMYPQPPTEDQMNEWEKMGYGEIRIVGPCPVIDRKTGEPGGVVYVVYRHRMLVVIDGVGASRMN